MSQPATAQTAGEAAPNEPAGKPADPAVEALEREKKIAELKKAIAEAEKQERAARLPATETTGAAGEVTVKEGAGYFAELLAYRALQELSAEVATRIGAPPTGAGPLLVSTDLELAKQAQLWEILSTRLRDFGTRMDDLIRDYPETLDFRESVAATLTAATAILGAAADVAAFFRSSLEISPRAVTLSERALEAAVAAALLDRGWKVVDPTFRLKKTILATQLETALGKRAALGTHRRALERRVRPDLTRLAQTRLDLEVARARLTKAEAAKPADPAAVQEAREAVDKLRQEILPLATAEGRWTQVAAEIDAALAAFDALVKAVTEGAEGKPSPLEAVALVDAVKSDPAARLLLLDVASQGGEIHVSRSVWSTRLTYVGGAVATFFLTDQDGTLEKTGTVARAAAESAPAREAATRLRLP